jgi:hypothetical protein
MEEKDDNWLKTQFPFHLVRSNMEGVYTIPPLPDNLDLKTASDTTLKQHGLLLHPPKPGAHSSALAAWNRVCERGLRIVAPHLAPVPESRRRGGKRPIRRHGGSGGSQQTSPSWCGCVLQPLGGEANWRSVTGTVTLPYLGTPTGGFNSTTQGQALSLWVGLDGWPGNAEQSSQNELLQAIVLFDLDATNLIPVLGPLRILWIIPDEADSSAQIEFFSLYITNAPPMRSGDLIQLSCAYFLALDGSIWGFISFLFFNQQEYIGTIIPGPTSISGHGGSVEWIMENSTWNLPLITPVFSGSEDLVAPTPVTFTDAYGQAEGVTGDPADGFKVLWLNPGNPASDVATVNLASYTVSITYTGPPSTG